MTLTATHTSSSGAHAVANPIMTTLMYSMDDSSPLDAGDFTSWVAETLTAHSENASADVPCGSCNACCRSSQFVLIEPEDPARHHIDSTLLVPAIGLPSGFHVMGYDERGHCPMLVDDSCSIYEHRPQTCRTYDCRVFPASGIWPDAGAKVEITARARRWRFELDDHGTRVFAATERAGTHLQARCSQVFGDHPPEPTQLAAMAVAAHELFLDDNAPTDDELLDHLRNTRT